MRKEVYFPEDRETRSILHSLKDEQRATGKSFSGIIVEALKEHTEKRRAWIQAKLSEYGDELGGRLEHLHDEFISPNPNHHPTWKACLEQEGLLTQPVIEYCTSRGWIVK